MGNYRRSSAGLRKILPFLFLSYLAVEYTEHRMSRKTKAMIYRAGKAGPLLGGLIGIISAVWIFSCCSRTVCRRDIDAGYTDCGIFVDIR